MAGIYFHIPFCKVKCSYCDFYKTTNNSNIEELVAAIKQELWVRRDYLNDYKVKTIYFGGGTPSLLSPDQLDRLITACYTVFDVDENAEITIEANPDDLSIEYLKEIRKRGVNRLSIGIQSFSQTDLKLMKRRHNPSQARNAVLFAKEAGFKNISVDLIYGVPGLSFEQWQKNLKSVFELDVQHLSAYHLTYHKGTKLWTDLHQGKISEVEETYSIQQFEELVNTAKNNAFEQYEISNFCKDGLISKHNTSYWNQTEYLGLGPSAHSYNKISRQWNVSNLTKYLEALSEGRIPFEIEKLTEKERYNDYVITSLRTIWGVDLNKVKIEFGAEYVSHVQQMAEKYSALNKIIIENENIKLAENGMFVSDAIMTDFML